MSASNFETVLDFETNFENAIATFLATDTGLASSSIFQGLDQDEFVNPRIEIFFEKGEALDPPAPQTANSTNVEYISHKASLSIRIISDASVTGTQTDHRLIRSKVRKSLLLNSLNFTTPGLLPYYAVKYLRPTGTSYEVDGDLAISSIGYDITFDIKGDAFPLATLRLKSLNQLGTVTDISTPVEKSYTGNKTLTTSFVEFGKIGVSQGTVTIQITAPKTSYDISTSDFTLVNASNATTIQAGQGIFTVDVATDSLTNGDNIDIGIFYEN